MKKILSFNIDLKYTIINSVLNTQYSKQLARNYFGLKSAKHRNLQKTLTEIFKYKTGLTPELMNDTFEFIKKSYSLRSNKFAIQDKGFKRQNMEEKQKNMA